MANDQEYPVVTQFRGELNYAKIADVRPAKWGRVARLAEPFGSKMGPFNYEDLLNKGRAENQGYTVYTTEFWKSNRDVEIRKYMKMWFPKGLFEHETNVEEIGHRRVLQLPNGGALLKSEIEQAVKLCAKSAHPDAGGSDEQFKQLLAAKDALVQSWRR
jgi:hypothetical protein